MSSHSKSSYDNYMYRKDVLKAHQLTNSKTHQLKNSLKNFTEMAKPLSTQLDRGFFLEIFIKTLSLSSPYLVKLRF